MKNLHIRISITLASLATIGAFLFSGRTVAIFALAASTVVWWAFVGWYSLKAKWFSKEAGRNVMGVAFGLSLVQTLFLIGVVFGRYTGYEIVWAAMFILLASLGVHRIYYMNLIQSGRAKEQNTTKQK